MSGPWSQTREEILTSLGVDAEKGLATGEVSDRLKRHGANRLQQERRLTFWGVFKEEVTEPMILLLLFVGVVYALWGALRDAITIFVIILLLVFTEIFTEYRAKKAVSSLRKLSPPLAPVLRDGAAAAAPTPEIVPGDILLLEVGVMVPADGRVIESFGLQADESALTGESVPVDKDERPVSPETALAERRDMVYAGTIVTRGRGRAVATATGMASELGRITGLVLEAKEPKTPLQLAMKQLAGLLVWVAVFFSVVIPAVGLLQGKKLKDMVLTGLSMSFATIPEELPIVITMVLGVGALALSKRHVLVRRLRAAETLGAVTAIVTDKTGTLTENRMSLDRLVPASGPEPESAPAAGPSAAAREILEIGRLTANVKEGPAGGLAGDAMDVALVEAAAKAGTGPAARFSSLRLRKEFSFDNRRKRMSAVFAKDGNGLVLVKGAPEAVVAASTSLAAPGVDRPKTPRDEAAIQSWVDEMAGRGMRVLAFARKETSAPDAVSQEEAEKDLVFVGLAGFADPVRPGVAEAVKAITGAGIRILVVSGDHPMTVERVAAEAGIPNGRKPVTGPELESMTPAEFGRTVGQASLFARTTAEQKLEIVNRLRQAGEIVAATGDGINDAPALKSADIGIAMGETGTEVAREAANMVLTDDSFISIADGVREGRKIFDNLTKGITYYLCVKVALVLSFLAALVLSIPFPFAPIQIILLELFMDLAASATFVAEPVEPGVMNRRPRDPRGRFVDRRMLGKIAMGSISLAAAVVTNYIIFYRSGWGVTHSRTVAFATWLIGHIFLALTMRSDRERLGPLWMFSNRAMTAWAAAGAATLIAATSIPQARAALKLSPMAFRSWLLAVSVPFVTIFWRELFKPGTAQGKS